MRGRLSQQSNRLRAPSRGSAIAGALWLPVILAASLPFLVAGWTTSRIQSPASPAANVANDHMRLPQLFSPEIQHWTEHIQRWAVQYSLPAELVATVMQIESCGHPAIESTAGALGLFQVMPYHFGTDEQAMAPEVNARRGLGYLARSLELAGGDLQLALAGYNGGHGVIGRAEASWPEETRRYAAWGIGILEDVQHGRATSPALQAWLQAGGASLCQQAAQYLGLE